MTELKSGNVGLSELMSRMVSSLLKGSTYLADYLVVSEHLSPKSWGENNLRAESRTELLGLDGTPCVCGFLTSISKKLSGTLYISSICTDRGKSRLLLQMCSKR